MLRLVEERRHEPKKPKPPPDLGEMLHPYVPHAVAALIASLDDPDLRLGACRIILERVYGKAPQLIDATQGAQALTALHLLAARALSDAFAEQAMPAAGPIVDVRPPANPGDLSAPALE